MKKLLFIFSVLLATVHADVEIASPGSEFAAKQKQKSDELYEKSIQKLSGSGRFTLKSATKNVPNASKSFLKEGVVRKKCNSSSRMEKVRGGCDCCYGIKQEDIGSEGLVITKPGCYKLLEDITFSPNSENTFAIKIVADNVSLDLCHHTLSQSYSSFTQLDQVTAIKIEPGFNDIEIMNGFIEGFSNQGIWAEAVDDTPNNHKNILIDSITIRNVGKLTTQFNERLFFARSGIGIDGTTNVVIRNCTVSQMSGLSKLSVVSALLSDKVLIENVTVCDNQLSGEGLFLEGIYVYRCNWYTIQDCQIVDNEAKELPNFFAEVDAIVSVLSNGGVIQRCDIERNSGKGIVGIIARNSLDTQTEINECSVCNNLGKFFFNGILCLSGDNFQVSDCLVTNNVVSTSETENAVRLLNSGYLSLALNVSNFTNCISESNSIEDFSEGLRFRFITGFDIEGCQQVTFENCRADGQFLNAEEKGAAAGYFLTNNRWLEFRNCKATRNTASNTSNIQAGFMVGNQVDIFNTFRNRSVLFDNCFTQANVNIQDPANGFGMLFGYSQTGQSSYGNLDSVVRNCTFINELIGLQVNGDLTMSNAFENNRVQNCIEAGIDDNTGQDNAYYRNVGYDNNNQSYLGLPVNTPIQTWTVGNVPAAATAGTLDNIAVEN